MINLRDKELKVVDINESVVAKFVELIRPESLKIREQLDIGYSREGNIYEIFEICPRWDKPEETINTSFARIRFYRSKRIWKLYWKRASGKWESYPPLPESTHLEKLLEEIVDDKHACFFG